VIAPRGGSLSGRWLVYALIALVFATLQHRLRETYAAYEGSRYDTASIAAGRSVSPIQRRILIPWLAAQVTERTGAPLRQVELGIRAVSLTATLIALDALLTALGFGAMAVAGPLLLACLLPLGFYVNPVIDSYPAMALLALGLLCIQRGAMIWTLPIILVGAWIRESVVLIPVVFLFASISQRNWKTWLPIFAAQLACYAVVRLVLRALYPGPDFDLTLGFNLAWARQAGAAEGLLRLLVLFLPFGVAALGLRHTSGLARGMAWVGMLSGVGLVMVARLSEPRVLWDSYLLLTPALVSAACPRKLA